MRSLKVLRVAALFIGFSVSMASAQTAVERYLSGELKISTEFAYDGPPIVLSYSTFLGSSGTNQELYRAMWKRLDEDTGGKVQIQPFWSSSLNDTQTGAFEAISSGLADMGTCYTQFNPGGFDLHFGIQLPTLFESSSVGSLVFNEIYAKYLRAAYERRGVYLARLGLTPPQQLSTKEPLKTLADMQGKRAWAAGSVSVASVAALGLEPTTLKASEIYPGFQTGVLDVVPMHDAGFYTFRLNEIAKYQTEVDLWTNPNEHCINPERWNSLPKPVRDYLYHWLQVWTQVESQLYYDAEAEKARTHMRNEGIEFFELSPADAKELAGRYDKLITDWIAVQENAGQPASEMIAEIRDLSARYAAMTPDERFLQVLDQPVPGMMPGY
ncbi:TRAP transporter substrate-binding protein DctP [Mesorhizobium sp. 1B3]|uniref:TRAP transporter substrate-binding protein DctP n=1 Tax=Mesorhizobium sp. 1B3 TaxID=3243599 RepID=UPI003D95FC8B